jgi:hypothetical protein
MTIRIDTFGLQQSDILSDATPFAGADVALVKSDTTNIKAVTDGIAVLTESGGTKTTDGTLQTLYINNAPSGVYKPEYLAVDFTNQTAGETIQIIIKYRIKSGGNLITDNDSPADYAGVVAKPLVYIPLKPNRFGISITIQKTAGANQSYDWEIIYSI